MATKTKQSNVLVIYNIDINMLLLQGRILNKDCTVSKGGIVLDNNRINTRMRLTKESTEVRKKVLYRHFPGNLSRHFVASLRDRLR